ncbi:GIY-YIG nuclease family protein [Lysobacter sp. CA196]|uniref:GIY-YIG nuclease family protein n=1 Tax=Lysobacter sp. CA196 TaxID=3455606 RepID=UPI003F8D51FE
MCGTDLWWVDIVISDKAVTDIAGAGTKERKIFEKAIASQILYERKVQTLVETGCEPASVLLPPFELKVEVEGYWERLPFGTYGSGPEGERVLGRTWVRKTLSKRQASMYGSSVAGSFSDRSQALPAAEEGYIYVLRNAAHQIDIFKVGLTRRSVSTRAAELSRGTGIPDIFLTVQSWWVPDVVYAEKRIHKILDGYRLKDAREFFKAEYAVIRSAIDLVVGELSGRVVPA